MIAWGDNGVIYGIRSQDWGNSWGSITGFGPAPIPESISDTSLHTADYPDLTWNSFDHSFSWEYTDKIFAKVAMGGMNLGW